MSTVTFAPTATLVMRAVAVSNVSAGTLGAPTPGRKSLEVQNIGTYPVAIGLAGVTYTTGRQLAAGASWALDLADTVTLYAVASGGTSTVVFTEVK